MAGCHRWSRRGQGQAGECRPDGDCTAESRIGKDADGARHPKKSGGVFCEGVAVRYAFIERHEQVWPITVQCRVLAVSASGHNLAPIGADAGHHEGTSISPNFLRQI